MRKRKRPISLIETIVCLGLVALLLSSLSFWYRSVTHQKHLFNKLKGPLMEERYAQQRLQRILSNVGRPFFTSTSDKSLLFIFDRGPFEHPKLSGKVLGRLYFDEPSNSLCLGIWPYPDKDHPEYHPSQTVVLLDGVAQCYFSFYSPPDLFQKPVDPEEVGHPRPREGWQDEWLNSYDTMPALVKVVIERDLAKGIKGHTIEYQFDLPYAILFPKESV